MCIGNPGGDGMDGQFGNLKPQRGGSRQPGIVRLVVPDQGRPGEQNHPRVVAIEQSIELRTNGPVAARTVEGCPQAGGLFEQHEFGLGLLGTENDRDIGAHDPRLLAGNGSEVVAQKFTVIERDRSDDAQRRPVDHIGGVEPSAKPHFEDQEIGGIFGKQQKGRGRGDLEKSDWPAA